MLVTVAGAGPSGAAAAIAAAQSGAEVRLFDRSRFPRHKVCGEFLSPEIAAPLDRLGLTAAIAALRPARIERLYLRFPSLEKTARLPEPALGLSRFRFDQLLLEHAVAAGAAVSRDAADLAARPLVLATGRSTTGARRGDRLFGFKAHYEGPPSDAIELYFFNGAYVGLNSIEDGLTNVCGLAPESALRRIDFDYDALLHGFRPLQERLHPLHRRMDWLSVGPLLFGNRFHEPAMPQVYPTGDSLSFVDPFTGTGLAGALITGRLAGICAAESTPVEVYVKRCRQSLRAPFAAASLFRSALNTRWAETAATLIPASWLVRWTRPKSAA